MTQFFQLHPDNPQPRLLQQIAARLHAGEVGVIPTDASYVLVCGVDQKQALERIRRIRQLNDKHQFSVLCQDLANIATYAQVDNQQYRFLKQHVPGAFTFILVATKELPRRLSHPTKKTIGIRIPQQVVCQAILLAFGEPLLATTLILPPDQEPLCDPYDMQDMLSGQVDFIVDGGYGSPFMTTVLDLSQDEMQLVRQGLGEV
jgi:tRNA threonylcarbamoyl adenosine modification protein (Sua5/YciO/YrdC/YwlC family)